jgi:hypothetical protein
METGRRLRKSYSFCAALGPDTLISLPMIPPNTGRSRALSATIGILAAIKELERFAKLVLPEPRRCGWTCITMPPEKIGQVNTPTLRLLIIRRNNKVC